MITQFHRQLATLFNQFNHTDEFLLSIKGNTLDENSFSYTQ
jgi:hypothetical protein